MPIMNSVIAGGGGTTNNGLVLSKDSNNCLVYDTSATNIDFTGVQYISEEVSLRGAYKNNTTISGVVNLSTLIGTKTGCNDGTFRETFMGCTNITGVSMPNFTSFVGNRCCQEMFSGSGITGNLILNFPLDSTYESRCYQMFADCPLITSVIMYGALGGLNSCQSMFSGCLGLVTAEIYRGNASFSGGTGQFRQMFSDCTGLTKAKLVTGGIFANYSGTSLFQNCSSLTTVWWQLAGWGSSYKGALSNMLSGCSGVTVHFPIAIQSTISSYPDVINGFGGTNTTVLYDIVVSLTGADTNTYTRSEKDSVSTATAWIYNNTLYYTSGVNEPSVGDTIYSDAACTQSVTSITAVA